MAEEEMNHETHPYRTCKHPQKRPLKSEEEKRLAMERSHKKATGRKESNDDGKRNEAEADDERQQSFTFSGSSSFAREVVADLIQQASRDACRMKGVLPVQTSAACVQCLSVSKVKQFNGVFGRPGHSHQ